MGDPNKDLDVQTSHNRSPNQRTPRMTKKQGENPPLKGKQQVTEKRCLHMEVDEGAIGLPPTSPVSREDDDLLDENGAVEVEAGLAHLTVSSPSGQVREGEDTSIAEAPPPLEGEEV